MLFHSKSLKGSGTYLLAGLLLFVMGCSPWFVFPACADNTRPDKTDKAVEPTHWGKVSGQVYDAETGAPIKDAVVVVEHEGKFEAHGRTVGKTDSDGRYHCEGMLGRVSSNIDVGRVITNLLVPFAGGSVDNATKRIDVSRMTVHIEKADYHPFEGVVTCRELTPEHFSVVLEPVLLTPSSASEVSTATEGWGTVRIESVHIDPPVLNPGSKATLSVRVITPAFAKRGEMQVVCACKLLGKRELHLQKETGEPYQDFVTTFSVPHMKQGLIQNVQVTLVKSPFDVAPEGGSRNVLLQVVTNESEARQATLRAEAFAHLQARERVQAVEPLKTLCQAPTPIQLDVVQLGLVAMAVKDYPTAVAARKQLCDLVAKQPETNRLRTEALYAEALTANGQSAMAISILEPQIQTVPVREREKKIPASVLLTLGQCYLAAARLDSAETIRQELVARKVTSELSGMSDFENGLRLAQAKAKADAFPQSALAVADYGRVLLDQGRWEEAVDRLQAAQQLDPNLPAIQRDLTFATLALKGGEQTAQKSLEEAIRQAQQEAILVKGNARVKSKDFFAWYTLGMLLYTKYRGMDPADPKASATLENCQDALIEALKCGRSGASVSNGSYSPLFGYTSTRVVGIAGFAYPQANSVFLIRESLKALRADSNDYLALFNLGTALIDLGHGDLALAPIKKVRDLKPDFIEGRYAEALIALQRGDREEGLKALREVTQANPRHPHALSKLAELYTEEGDVASASACLAAYARVYGVKDVEVEE